MSKTVDENIDYSKLEVIDTLDNRERYFVVIKNLVLS